MGTPSKSSSRRTFALVAPSLPSSCPATLPSCVAWQAKWKISPLSSSSSIETQAVAAAPLPNRFKPSHALELTLLTRHPSKIRHFPLILPSSELVQNDDMKLLARHVFTHSKCWHPVFLVASVVVSRCVMSNLNKPLCITLAWVGRFVVGWSDGCCRETRGASRPLARSPARPTPAVGGHWAGSNFLTER